jgi:hypothetical protein
MGYKNTYYRRNPTDNRVCLICVLSISMKILASILCAALLALALSSCGTVYSPTLQLPYSPLQKDDGVITAARSNLPSPGSVGVGFSHSGEGSVRYGFSDRVTLQGKAWSDLSLFSNSGFNGGLSLGGMYLLTPHDAEVPIALVPTGSMLIKGNSISAMGLIVQTAAWFPTFWVLRPYGAVGFGILANDFKDGDWGYGAISNIGLSAKLSESFYVNAEFYLAGHKYLKDPNTYYIYGAPSLSISWKFNNY